MPRKTGTPTAGSVGQSRFNEAAARCRGKPLDSVIVTDSSGKLQ